LENADHGTKKLDEVTEDLEGDDARAPGNEAETFEEVTENSEQGPQEEHKGKINFMYSAKHNAYTYEVISRMKNKHRFTFGDDLQLFLEMIHQSLGDDIRILRIFMQYNRANQIFRASPRCLGKAWRDWVMVDWGMDGILPAQLWCFLDLRQLTRNHVVQGLAVTPGIYAVAECAYENDDEEEKRLSALFVPYTKETTINNDGSMSRRFYLVDVDAFYSPACIIPDIGNENPSAYLRLLPKADWSDQFSDWLRSEHTREFSGE
jgi:hypothetical protein